MYGSGAAVTRMKQDGNRQFAVWIKNPAIFTGIPGLVARVLAIPNAPSGHALGQRV